MILELFIIYSTRISIKISVVEMKDVDALNQMLKMSREEMIRQRQMLVAKPDILVPHTSPSPKA